MTRSYPILTALMIPGLFVEATGRNYVEEQGMVAVEAEHFVSQSNDEIRRWYVTSAESIPLDLADPDGNHATSASGTSYIEILPDNRTNHDEKLIPYKTPEADANFSPIPGKMGVITYPVYFNNPGVYLFWARAFSTGPEDNGLHVGIDGTWPESGSRVQLCPGKYQWTWSSAQRRSDNHCGDPRTITLTVSNPGIHSIMLSMREDGFELDKFILTKDFTFEPEGKSIPASIRESVEPSRGKYFADVPAYDYLLNATTNFSHVEGSVEYYVDKRNQALAINASVKQNREAFAVAGTHFSFKPGKYKMTLVTLTETDGESEYRVQVDGRTLGDFRNPPSKQDYQEILFDCGVVELKPKAEIEVAFNAVTNGKIPENNETAYSRGRWRGLVLTEVK